MLLALALLAVTPTAPAPFAALPLQSPAGTAAPLLYAPASKRLKEQAICDASTPALEAADDEGNAWQVDVGGGAGAVIVVLDDGPSGDPTVCVFAAKSKQHLATVNAGVFVVPGNGFVFTVATVNVYAETRRKWRLGPAGFVEVPQALLAVETPQPFVVGCANSPQVRSVGVARPRPLVLRAAPNDGAAEVATLTPGTPARLLGRSFTADDNERPAWVLVQSGFGLIGWARPVDQDAPVDNACFFRAGD